MKNVKAFINAVLLSILFIFVLFIGCVSFPKLAHSGMFDLKEVSLQYKSFLDGSYDPIINNNGIPNKTLDKELNLNVNMDVYSDLFFFNNTVHSFTDRSSVDGSLGQFRLIGWNYRLGFRMSEFIHLYYEHFSQHLLDSTYAFGPFPIQNSFGFTLYFYSKPAKPGLF